MTTDIDWQRELDASFGTAPDEPIGTYVAAGRRAVRRRRAVAVALAASIAVGGTAVWAASPGSAPRGETLTATQGTRPAQSKGTSPDQGTSEERLRSLEDLRRSGEGEIDFRGEPAVLVDGGPVLSPQTSPVLQREPNPMAYAPSQGESLAIRVLFKGSEHYSLMSVLRDGTSSTSTTRATGDFAAWLDQAVRDLQ